jgi:hypothetical protein
MYDEHVLITGNKYSLLSVCPHLQNVHPQHLFTMYDEYVLITGSKYIFTFGSKSSPGECESSAYIHCWTMKVSMSYHW